MKCQLELVKIYLMYNNNLGFKIKQNILFGLAYDEKKYK
jgi:hypothetical protein